MCRLACEKDTDLFSECELKYCLVASLLADYFQYQPPYPKWEGDSGTVAYRKVVSIRWTAWIVRHDCRLDSENVELIIVDD